MINGHRKYYQTARTLRENQYSAGADTTTRVQESDAPTVCAKGHRGLKTMLVQCAWSAVRKKRSYYQVQFQRLRHRQGPKKAICAVAASILTAIYPMLRDGTVYKDRRADHFIRSPEVQAHRLAKQIAKLGFTCTIQLKQVEAVSI